MSETQTELRTTVSQHHTVLFGVEGQGGLIREVSDVKETVRDHEKRLNVLSGKWLFLMLLAGILGNSLGATVLRSIQTLQFFK